MKNMRFPVGTREKQSCAYGMRVIETVRELPSLWSCAKDIKTAGEWQVQALAPAAEHWSRQRR